MGAATDRFYGHRETAALCEHVITSLFSVAPTTASDGLQTPPQSPNLNKSSPPPLGEFIAYALYRTRLPISITHQALLLLSRLKARYPSARGTATSPHRLFLSSLMLSSKISMDDTYSNKSWQVVGQGLFELREVNQMERELFAFLGWNVVVRDEELAAWVSEVVGDFLALQEALNAPPKSMDDRKRRRDNSTSANALPSPTPSSSSTAKTSSRSASPEERDSRHRRASDAAQALLHGDKSDSSSIRSRRSRPRTPASEAVHVDSSCSSECSSSVSSPLSGSTTPGSPGPMTPLDGSPPTTWMKDVPVPVVPLAAASW